MWVEEQTQLSEVLGASWRLTCGGGEWCLQMQCSVPESECWLLVTVQLTSWALGCMYVILKTIQKLYMKPFFFPSFLPPFLPLPLFLSLRLGNLSTGQCDSLHESQEVTELLFCAFGQLWILKIPISFSASYRNGTRKSLSRHRRHPVTYWGRPYEGVRAHLHLGL